MSTQTESKINQLLHSYPKGAVLLSSWLTEEGYSLDLQKRYKSSRWLDSIGRGAMVRTGETVDYLGAIYALQTRPGWSVHPGGRSALSLLGKSQYLELSTQKAVLFADAKTKLPSWFEKYDWGLEINFYASSFLPPHLGLTTLDLNNFSIKISGAARAIMECLFLAPKKQQLLEAYELMEGLNNLRPDLVQSLLEQCESVKVKRLFLYLAEKAEHDWFHYLNINKIDLGKGKRSLVAGGVYIAKYQITVPEELEAQNNEQGL
ncbi:MAG: hypothetical protein COA71_03835 [SAR86 cluster bacterium]|uniref:Transcriptional regulator AbiEi antitoxin N-terminal domain-containing protein n=1 Tax=SAR86 cluster bacterium TaxID=2030880 RepID=A0A2A5CFJ7_9GAMM|nr:type IV toxin-antitoxin system AbiEi family antitoxin [Gammaproteobacteria bacterium AH-315-E17]PCJ42647.1 MAG: hypothetical protein COA71_03835 [SAR86 cluster bacterium]